MRRASRRIFAPSACRGGWPTFPGALPDAERLLGYIAQDKKVTRGALTFILTRGVGQSFIARDVPASEVLSFLQGQSPGMTAETWAIVAVALALAGLAILFREPLLRALGVHAATRSASALGA